MKNTFTSHIDKKNILTFLLTSLSLYIFTIWKSIVYYRLCRDGYWKISACSTEYEDCDSFASLTRHQTSYSGSAGRYFRYQSIHIQITYTYLYLSGVSMFTCIKLNCDFLVWHTIWLEVSPYGRTDQLVRKEDERLSNITLRHKLKVQCFYWLLFYVSQSQ